MRTITSFLCILLSCSALFAQSVYLHDGWSFQQVEGTEWHAATVPGTVHNDLLIHGLIPDPFVGTNEDSVQWVSDVNWIYRSAFNVGPEMLQREFQLLRFHGLDTYCDVWLNDSLILEANNMFRKHDVDVKGWLRSPGNTLKLLFRSPIACGDEMLKDHGVELPGDEFSKEKHSSMFTRKAAYHYGWDWGPRLVTSGVWRPIELLAWDGAKIDRVSVRTDSITADHAWMIAEIAVLGDPSDAAITLMDPITQVPLGDELLLNGTAQLIKIPFIVTDPKLWWPNGHGDPHQYPIEVHLLQHGMVQDQVKRAYGIRTVELLQEKDDIGTSFFFNVNGQPISIRGANYIPQDMFLPRVTEQDHVDLIADVKRANMNMLRVWGGGIYESDAFYDQCDEQGILVWQDLMFANALFPATPEFLENVSMEVSQQVDRLKGHPCMALWCGNNEVDVAWKNWGWQDKFSPSQKRSIEVSYHQLFGSLLPNIITEKAPDQPYIPTSPLSNWGTPENFNHHNMHYWGVWHGKDDFSGYQRNVPRFMSEYGFQSFPKISTMLSVMDSSDLDLTSSAMMAHQKSYVGNRMIDQFVNQYFRTPHDFDDLVYLSQLTQQLGIRTAIKAQRTSPKCMGTLYWQLNDAWTGASWSTRDHSGNWKAAMYEVQRLYEPLAVMAVKDLDRMAVLVVNDGPNAIEGDLVITALTMDGTIIKKEKVNVVATTNSRALSWTSTIREMIGRRAPRECYVRAELLRDDSLVASDILLLSDPKELKLSKPDIRLEKLRERRLSIVSNTLAYGVELTLDSVEFDDNFFQLEPGVPREITTREELSEQQFNRITWRSFHE